VTSRLYIVPTPIGNLQDITLRALTILKSVDMILAEDTRKTGILLSHFEIKNSLKSYHSFNEHKQLQAILQWLKEGKEIALVSDAGVPGISDPGFLLIRECLKNEIPVEVLPGPTAFIPALLKSGFACDSFVFEGFLPHKKGKRSKIEGLKEEYKTSIFYESPHRLIKTLELIKEILGNDRRISVSRELTKIHEETITGTASEVLLHFGSGPIKGEIVLLIEGKTK